VKQVETLRPPDNNLPTRTRIDDHALLAKLCAMIGIVPVALYRFAFNSFGSSKLPWQIALAFEVICPTVVYTHYLLNRRSRRLFWEGIAAFAAFIPTWMLLGSHWLFYFGFAPMPSTTRLIALLFGFGMTAITVVVTLGNYRRAADRLGLVQRMTVVEPEFIVYPDKLDAGISMFERSWDWLPIPPVWLISLIGSIGTAFAMLTGRVFEKTGGPHILFIMLSVVGFPFSCLIIGHFFVRLAYFHIYLPLKLERETGKKVILGT
jgi:hypothetical protein